MFQFVLQPLKATPNPTSSKEMPRPRGPKGRFLKASKVTKKPQEPSPSPSPDPKKAYTISHLSKFAGAQLESMEAEGVIHREEGQALRFPGGEEDEEEGEEGNISAAMGSASISEAQGTCSAEEGCNGLAGDVDMVDAGTPGDIGGAEMEGAAPSDALQAEGLANMPDAVARFLGVSNIKAEKAHKREGGKAVLSAFDGAPETEDAVPPDDVHGKQMATEEYPTLPDVFWKYCRAVKAERARKMERTEEALSAILKAYGTEKEGAEGSHEGGEESIGSDPDADEEDL
ncbi:hypothetical protein MMC10_000898 [Thelotrema lepadinum]|nr:hypothetical protein [Thelotrema lepadinum]